jgi:hypothetical protein
MDTGFYFFRLEWSEIIFRDPWRVAMERNNAGTYRK